MHSTCSYHFKHHTITIKHETELKNKQDTFLLKTHVSLSNSYSSGYATMTVPKPLFFSLNWSLIMVLMRGKCYKTKIPLNLSLIVIHWPFYDGFPAPLAARVFLAFHLHAKTNFNKKKLNLVHQDSNPYHPHVNSMHNHLTNSCLMIINIIL